MNDVCSTVENLHTIVLTREQLAMEYEDITGCKVCVSVWHFYPIDESFCMFYFTLLRMIYDILCLTLVQAPPIFLSNRALLMMIADYFQ